MANIFVSLWIFLISIAPVEFYSIFDGRSFKGWSGETDRTWRIQDGAITGGSLTETVPHNEFLTSNRPYGDFTLELDFKLIGTGFVNAGVQFRSQRTQLPAYEMTGYQADLGKGYWGCLYDESRRNKVLAYADSNALQKVLKPNDWNHYKIQAKGPRIQLWINDLPTVDYTETDPSVPQTGLIGLQIHGGGKALVQYKNIRIEEY